MIPNEKSAVTFYENEMERTKRNIANIVKNSSNLTEVEFSNAIRQQLARYDECKEMKDYYISDCKIIGGLYNVSN